MGMRPTRRQTRRRRGPIVAVVAVLCVACCLASVAGYLLIKAGRGTNAAATANATIDPRLATLTVATSPEKATLIQNLADQFNARGLRTPDGQSEKITVVSMAPDEMVAEALATPSFQAMTPDSSLWLDQLNRKWAASQKVEPGQLPTTLADQSVRYAITPIVIAAWEDSAKSLGWPDQPVGWTSLQDRARQDPGFKWSHSSTSFASGLLATLAEFYAGAGVQRNLTAAQAQDPKTVAFVTAVEKTVHFYGEGELDTIKRAAQDGPKSLNAFVVSEQLVVAFNTGAFGMTPGRLVALYPTEGTLWDDHPLALLELPSVTANQRRTFQGFRDYLTSKDVQNQILTAGYRPTDLSIPLNGAASPLTSANGVNPTEPQTTLQLPSADVVSVVQNVSLLTRRKTNIFLVVDTSGSMQGAKLDNVKAALKTFLPCTLMMVLTEPTARGMRNGAGAPVCPDGDKDFFGFKTGIRYDEPIIPWRESRKNEGAVPVRLCRSLYSTVRASGLHGGTGNHRAGGVNDRSR